MSQQRKITHVIDMLIIFKYKIFKIIAASNNGFQYLSSTYKCNFLGADNKQ